MRSLRCNKSRPHWRRLAQSDKQRRSGGGRLWQSSLGLFSKKEFLLPGLTSMSALENLENLRFFAQCVVALAQEACRAGPTMRESPKGAPHEPSPTCSDGGPEKSSGDTCNCRHAERKQPNLARRPAS